MAEHVDYCELCGRIKRLTFHHLIPVTLHKNKWFKKNYSRAEMAIGIMLCYDCHGYIHKTWKAKEIGKSLSTVDALRFNKKMAKFIKFVRKKK